MKEIISLYVQSLSVKLFFSFMLFLVEAIDNHPVIGEMFPHFVEKVKAAYDHMNQVYLKYDEDFCTKKVQEADSERDKAFIRLNNFIRSFILSQIDAAKTQAAEILLEIIKLYGGAAIVNQGMNAKTTIYVNLIEDLEEKYHEQVETLGIGNLVNELKQKQQLYSEAYMHRAECNSEAGKNAMAEARKLMTKAYRDFVTSVNLMAEDDEDGILTPFINLINTEIGKYRTYTGQGQVGSNAGSGGEVTTELKYINFIYNNGTELKLWFAVGEPVIAPENTPGYEWKDLPEKMPKRSRTIREVPIEEETEGGAGSTGGGTGAGSGSAGGTGGGGTGSGSGTPQKFTITFTHNGEVLDSEELEVGATVSSPLPPAGYQWVGVPDTMPDHDVTVTTTWVGIEDDI